MQIEITKLHEAGYEQAMIGFAMSYKITIDRAKEIAPKYALKEGGHNKFLEHIDLWFVVRAPRYFWSEADTYRLTTKQSESTMHTLIKELTAVNIHSTFEIDKYVNDNFEDGWDSVSYAQLLFIREAALANDIERTKKRLPDGFMQAREWKVSYKDLRNINLQRAHHRLKHWDAMIESALKQVEYPEFLERKITAFGSLKIESSEN